MTKKLLNLKIEKKSFKEYLDALAFTYGITTIVAEFAGSGDSGEIESITGDFKDETIGFTVEEEAELTTFFDNYLAQTEYDWYNNDGGYGDVTLNLKTYVVTCDMNVNYVESNSYQLIDEEIVGNYTKTN